MRPNIFDIATKELSQDAFITWLIKYADETNKEFDIDIHKCGKLFVSDLIKKQIDTFDEPITKVVAGRQWQGIDVWAEVNDKYLVIIEDKTFTTHHSNQLFRYKEISTNWCKDNNYEMPVCIYLKTGNESLKKLKKIEEQGFSIFNRIDFINILKNFKSSNNNIFNDFLDRLIKLENLNSEFEEKLINNWQGNDWQGFFQLLEKEDKIEHWEYINNPNGGFWNAVVNWEFWNGYPVYLQLEEGKLCFKISTSPYDITLDENISRSKIRNDFHNMIISQAKECNLPHIHKPIRFGSGNYMTVAVVDRENWLGKDEDAIDKETVFKNLDIYLEFLRKII